MDTPLKQRLVGALILVALGVVFWPIIFVQPARESLPQPEGIPPAPRVDNSALPAPDSAGLRRSPPAIIADDKESVDVAMPDPLPDAGGDAPVKDGPVTRDTAPVAPTLDTDGIPVAWSLQVATMSSRDKAQALRDQLNDRDMKAYIKPLTRAGDTMYRVYVGPKFEREQLESIKQDVDSRYGVESLIARYVP